MSAVPVDSAEDDDEWGDLLPDDLTAAPKKQAQPLVRTPKQKQAKAKADALEVIQTATDARDAQLAQIVNLYIGGYTLSQIGSAIGATADEVDRMLANETQRYVRTQPALRTFVRNYISGKYKDLLDAVWEPATDVNHREKLENSDRALRILKEMGRLHGAEAPTQTEVKVESAPEAVEQLVAALAAHQGLGYDTDIFNVVEGEVVEDA